ncbi:MAG: fasciclin domain-containing protein [Saprospiraceae bacterium]|nr:fasciclin domain-containing protein [Saprospiraceae bacterium]
MLKKSISILAVAVSILAGNANAQDKMSNEKGVMVGGAMMVKSKNIVENAVNSKDHTTLVAAVKAAGLVETLSSAGPFTVFAPTNEAFNKLPAGTVDGLLKPEMKDKLTSVLTYHVVAGRYTSKDLMNGMQLKTVQGQKITITKNGNTWMVNNAKIEIADIMDSNGVTYVIDSVLMPK